MPRRKTNVAVGAPREEPADLLALTVRARKWGISLDQAKDQKAGTWHGVLCLQGRLTEGQYEGLSRFRDLKNKWRSVKGVPGRDTDGSQGGGGELSPEYVIAIEEAHGDMMDAIRERQAYSRRNLYAALDHVVMRCERHDHMLADLIEAGDALRVFFGVDGARR